jgi:hypothetical protein
MDLPHFWTLRFRRSPKRNVALPTEALPARVERRKKLHESAAKLLKSLFLVIWSAGLRAPRLEWSGGQAQKAGRAGLKTKQQL